MLASVQLTAEPAYGTQRYSTLDEAVTFQEPATEELSKRNERVVKTPKTKEPAQSDEKNIFEPPKHGAVTLEHTRFELTVGACDWYVFTPSHVVRAVHTRLFVAVGAVDSYVFTPSQGVATDEQTRFELNVGAVVWYVFTPSHTVRGAHVRADVCVAGAVWY